MVRPKTSSDKTMTNNSSLSKLLSLLTLARRHALRERDAWNRQRSCELQHEGFEQATAFFVVLELVEARAGRRQQNDVTFFCASRGRRNRRFEIDHALASTNAFHRVFDERRRFAEQNRTLHAATSSRYGVA